MIDVKREYGVMEDDYKEDNILHAKRVIRSASNITVKEKPIISIQKSECNCSSIAKEHVRMK